MKFAEALLKGLFQKGIRKIFGVPGRENAHILFNEFPGICFFTTRVEFNAGIVADFLGRFSKTPQVCFSTMGPGATNMVTAIASAMLNRSALIFFSTQIEKGEIFYNGAHQCIDQTSIFRPITKWSHELQDPSDLFWVLEKAFKTASQEPPGPVHIAIPVDFFRAEIEDKVPSAINSYEKEICPADNMDVIQNTAQEIRATILKSERAVCIAGAETTRLGLGDWVAKFCSEWEIPLIMSANAKGILPFDHPLSYGSASCYMDGIAGFPLLESIFRDVDLIICIGYQLVDDLLPKMWSIGRSKQIINLSTLPLEGPVRSRLNPNFEYSGQIDTIIGSILESGVTKKENQINPQVKKVYKSVLARAMEMDGLFSPIQVVGTLNKFFDKNSICVTDIGYYRHHAILFSNPPAPDLFFSDTGLSSFGVGLPYAIAAKISNPMKRIFLLTGDGGFHSSSCDLTTLVKQNLPIIVIVMNNSSYGLIQLYQERYNSVINREMVALGKVDFVKLAQANGCEGQMVTTIKELEKTIMSYDNCMPLIIEVPLDYSRGGTLQESF